MIAGRFAARIPYIRHCWSPSPKIHGIPLLTRLYSEPARRPRNEEIKHPMVRFVDPETGALQSLTSLSTLLASIAQKTHFLELVSESPEPIVRLVSKKARHERLKEIKQKKKENKMEQKEIQLTWGVAAGDLEHKLKKARQELMKGNRVSLVFAPRKGQPPLKPEQMAAKVQETADSLADIGKEWKARDMQKSTAAIHFQGIVVSSEPAQTA